MGRKTYKYTNKNNSSKSDKIESNEQNLLMTEKPQYLAKKENYDYENLLEKEKFKSNNKFLENKNPYNINKKNKISFKGEAKDFKIKYKTELCKYFEIYGYCLYGNKCAYAHGKENLRSKVTNTTAYRTKKCVQFFEQGYCPYGNRCQFAHQLKSNIINNPYDKGMSYGKILEIISKLENVENIKKLVEKPRLNVFKEICGNNNQNIKKLVEKPRLSVFEDFCDNKDKIESRLLEDIKGLRYTNLFERIGN